MSSIYTPHQNARECTRRRQQGLHLSPMAPPRTAPIQPYTPPVLAVEPRLSHYRWNATRERVERRFPKVAKGNTAVRAHKRQRQAQRRLMDARA